MNFSNAIFKIPFLYAHPEIENENDMVQAHTL